MIENGMSLFETAAILTFLPLQRFLFGKITRPDKAQVVYELRHKYSVKALVELANIPRSTYYNLVKKMNRPDVDADLKAEMKAIYEENEGRYGYRRIRDELTNRGQKVNHKRFNAL